MKITPKVIILAKQLKSLGYPPEKDMHLIPSLEDCLGWLSKKGQCPDLGEGNFDVPQPHRKWFVRLYGSSVEKSIFEGETPLEVALAAMVEVLKGETK